MAKQRDDSEVLKTIIAKSTNKSAVAAAQNELGALQQRKASIAAAIQPALDVPQIVAQPTSKGVQLGDEDSSKDLKAIRKDMSQMLSETKKSRTLLEGILKTNQKYYESNSELINRLMMATGLSQEQIEALAKKQKAGAGQTGGVGTDTGKEDDSSGGGGLLGLLGGGLAGLLGTAFGRKKPAVDGDADKKNKKKKKKTDADNDKKNKGRGKNKGKGGRIAKLLGLTAAIFGGLEAFDFLTDEDAEWSDLVPDAVKDYIPENVINAAPDAALAIGLQAPTIANTLRGGPTPPAPSTPDDKPPPKKQAKPPAKPAAPKPSPKGPSPAQEIWNDRIRQGAKATEKEILEAAAEKVGKSTVKSALKKIPIFGLLAGLGLGGYRYLWEGDAVGAGLEVGAGAAAIVPGVGTVGSVGIDVASLVRDIYASVYETYPEEDAKVGERFTELNSVVMKYLSDTFGSSTPEPQSSTGASDDFAGAIAATTSTNTAPPPAEDSSGGVSMYNAGDDFAGAIAATTNAYTETDTSVNPNKSRAEYLKGTGTAPAPVQKMTPNKLNVIGNPSNAAQPNVVINKQGDTINNVTNGNAGGGGSSGVAGSPSKIPSPFDTILYGDTFNWGY